MRTLGFYNVKQIDKSTPFIFGILGHRSCIPTSVVMRRNPYIGWRKLVSAYLTVKYLGARQGFSGLLAESVVGALR